MIKLANILSEIKPMANNRNIITAKKVSKTHFDFTMGGNVYRGSLKKGDKDNYWIYGVSDNGYIRLAPLIDTIIPFLKSTAIPYEIKNGWVIIPKKYVTLNEMDVQGGLSFNVDDDESWMYDDLGGPFNEIKSLPSVTPDSLEKFMRDLADKGKISPPKAIQLVIQSLRKNNINPFPKPFEQLQYLPHHELLSLYKDIVNAIKDGSISEIYTDDLGGEEIYGS